MKKLLLGIVLYFCNHTKYKESETPSKDSGRFHSRKNGQINKETLKTVAPANRKHFDIVVVGAGLAGALGSSGFG